MDKIIKIASDSFTVWIASLALAVGIGMLAYGMISSAPSRESLQKVEGVITEASRTTRTSRRSKAVTSYYEMTLKPAGGAAEVKLRVPTIEIPEPDVRSLIGRPVLAEFDSEKDVYVLRSGTREVLTYQNTLERRNLNFRQYYVDGIALITGGSVLGLIGFLLGYRKLRKAAATDLPPAQG